MKTRMTQLQEIPVAFDRKIGPYGQANQLFMEAFKSQLKAQSLLKTDHVIIAAVWDNPLLTPPEACRYDVALMLTEEREIPPFQAGQLPGGDYLIVTLMHTQDAIQACYRAIDHLLQDAQVNFDESRPILEKYDAKLLSQHQCEICIPVK